MGRFIKYKIINPEWENYTYTDINNSVIYNGQKLETLHSSLTGQMILLKAVYQIVLRNSIHRYQIGRASKQHKQNKYNTAIP